MDVHLRLHLCAHKRCFAIASPSSCNCSECFRRQPCAETLRNWQGAPVQSMHPPGPSPKSEPNRTSRLYIDLCCNFLTFCPNAEIRTSIGMSFCLSSSGSVGLKLRRSWSRRPKQKCIGIERYFRMINGWMLWLQVLDPNQALGPLIGSHKSYSLCSRTVCIVERLVRCNYAVWSPSLAHALKSGFLDALILVSGTTARPSVST